MPTPKNVRSGAGQLFIAPVGTTEPTTAAAALNAAWVDLGYTAEGHTFEIAPSFDPIEVAESLNPIRYEATGIEYTVTFAMAESTARNYQIAMNGGTITTATGQTTFTPPLPGSTPTRVALLWKASDAKELVIYRKCLQTGSTETSRQKGSDYATLPVEFMLEQPDSGTPFVRLADES